MSNAKIVFEHIHIISQDPEAAAAWYADVLGGQITSVQEKLRGAPQFAVTFEGAMILIRGQRPGEEPGYKRSLQSFKDYVSHNQWGTDHFGFTVHGDLDQFCDELKQKGVTFTVEPHDFLPGVRLAYIEAPDGVSIEFVQAKQ